MNLRRFLIRAMVLIFAAVAPAGAQVAPDHDACVLQRTGNAEASLSRIAACTRLIQTSGATGTELALLYASRGHANLIASRYDEAVTDYQMMARLDPNRTLSTTVVTTDQWWLYSWTYYMRGRALADTGRHEEAIGEYTTGLSVNPFDPASASLRFVHGVLHYWRGSSHRNLQQNDEALADFNGTLGIDPNFKIALNGRAAILQERAGGTNERPAPFAAWAACPGNQPSPVEAEAACTTIINSNMQTAGYLSNALAQRGYWRTAQGNMQEARQDIDRALVLWPESISARVYSARWNLDSNLLDAALADVDAALRIEPDVASRWGFRGSVLQRLGRFEDAVASFDRALRLDSSLEDVRDARREAWLAVQARGWGPERQREEQAAAQRLLNAAITAARGGDARQIGQALSAPAAGPTTSGQTSGQAATSATSTPVRGQGSCIDYLNAYTPALSDGPTPFDSQNYEYGVFIHSEYERLAQAIPVCRNDASEMASLRSSTESTRNTCRSNGFSRCQSGFDPRPPSYRQGVQAAFDRIVAESNAASGQQQAATPATSNECARTPDQELAAFTSDVERLRAQHPIPNAGGARDQHVWMASFSAASLQLLEPRRACMGPHSEANRSALVNARDTAVNGCEGLSTSTGPAARAACIQPMRTP